MSKIKMSELIETDIINDNDLTLLYHNGSFRKIRANAIKGTTRKIIDDLVTTSVDAILSAQQGVVLNRDINELSEIFINIEERLANYDKDFVYIHPETHPASMITGLSKTAVSGLYNDLVDKDVLLVELSDLEDLISEYVDRINELIDRNDMLQKDINLMVDRLHYITTVLDKERPIQNPDIELKPLADINTYKLDLWLDAKRYVDVERKRWGDCRDNNKYAIMNIDGGYSLQPSYFNNAGVSYLTYSNGIESYADDITISMKVVFNGVVKDGYLISFNGIDKLRICADDEIYSGGYMNIFSYDNREPIDDGLHVIPGHEYDLTFVISKTFVKYYLNGRKIREKNYIQNNPNIILSDLMYIGTDNTGTRTSNISLLYLLVYNRALTDGEVSDNYVKLSDNVIAIPDITEYIPDVPDISDEEKNSFRHNLSFFDYERSTYTEGNGIYFLSPSGSDSNSGNRYDAPLKTFEAFKQRAELSSATDIRLYVNDGDYYINNDIELYGNSLGIEKNVNIIGLGNKAIFKSSKLIDKGSITQEMNGNMPVYRFKYTDLNMDDTSIIKYGFPLLICNNDLMNIASYPAGDSCMITADRKINYDGKHDMLYFNNIDFEILRDITSGYMYTNMERNNSMILYNCKNIDFTNANARADKGVSILRTGKYNIDTNDRVNVICKFVNNKKLLVTYNQYYIDTENQEIYFTLPKGKRLDECKIEIADRKYKFIAYPHNDSKCKYEIERINFVGFKNGILEGDLSNITFKACVFKAFGYIGLYGTNGCKEFNMTNCKMGDSYSSAIILHENMLSESYRELEYTANTIDSCSFIHTSIFGPIDRFVTEEKQMITTGYDEMKTNMCMDSVCMRVHGGIIRNNLFYRTGGPGVIFDRNETQVINNDFVRCVQRIADAGAIEAYNSILTLDSKIFNNVVKDMDLISSSNRSLKPKKYGIYLNNLASFITVDSNNINGCDIGINIGGGRHNKIINNSLSNNYIGIAGDSRGLRKSKKYDSDKNNAPFILYDMLLPIIAGCVGKLYVVTPGLSESNINYGLTILPKWYQKYTNYIGSELIPKNISSTSSFLNRKTLGDAFEAGYIYGQIIAKDISAEISIPKGNSILNNIYENNVYDIYVSRFSTYPEMYTVDDYSPVSNIPIEVNNRASNNSFYNVSSVHDLYNFFDELNKYKVKYEI